MGNRYPRSMQGHRSCISSLQPPVSLSDKSCLHLLMLLNILIASFHLIISFKYLHQVINAYYLYFGILVNVFLFYQLLQLHLRQAVWQRDIPGNCHKSVFNKIFFLVFIFHPFCCNIMAHLVRHRYYFCRYSIIRIYLQKLVYKYLSIFRQSTFNSVLLQEMNNLCQNHLLRS